MMAVFMSEPSLPAGKGWGYSLVKSNRTNCEVGKNVRITPPYRMYNAFVGDFSYISGGCGLFNVRIGKCCSIGGNFKAGLGLHPLNGISTHPMFYSSVPKNGMTLCAEDKMVEMPEVEIGNDVFIGENVTIVGTVKIGDGAVIGAGAVVTKDIPPYAIAVGVPAKVIKYRFDERTIERLLKRQWWNDDIEKLKNVEKYFWDVEAFLNEKDE